MGTIDRYVEKRKQNKKKTKNKKKKKKKKRKKKRKKKGKKKEKTKKRKRKERKEKKKEKRKRKERSAIYSISFLMISWMNNLCKMSLWLFTLKISHEFAMAILKNPSKVAVVHLGVR